MDPLQFQMLLRELQDRGVDPQSFLDEARSRKVGQPPPLTSALLNPQPRPTPQPTTGQSSPRMDVAPTGNRGIPATNPPSKADSGGGYDWNKLIWGEETPGGTSKPPVKNTGSSLGETMMAGQYPIEMGMVPELPEVSPPQMSGSYQPLPADYASGLQDSGGKLPMNSSMDNSTVMTAPTASAAPTGGGGSELPFETYQRLTGNQWTGGRSGAIMDILNELGITENPGSAGANLALQKALLANAGNIQG